MIDGNRRTGRTGRMLGTVYVVNKLHPENTIWVVGANRRHTGQLKARYEESYGKIGEKLFFIDLYMFQKYYNIDSRYTDMMYFMDHYTIEEQMMRAEEDARQLRDSNKHLVNIIREMRGMLEKTGI